MNTKSYAMNRIRLIRDGIYAGSCNMAIDEALLVQLVKGESLPTLRFYRWEKPTVSLGYFQKLREFNLERIGAMNLDIVRRPTGGRAVLHWDEVTFCLTIPTKNQGLWDIFRGIHEAIGRGLNILGIPAKVLPVLKNSEEKSNGGSLRTSACFASPSRYELTLNGKKIAGSAQKKYGDFMLIHGSIPIKPNFRMLFNVVNFPDEESRTRAYESGITKMTSLFDEMGRDYDFEVISDAIVSGFEEKWESEIKEGKFSEAEWEEIHKLNKEKYGTKKWIEKN